MLFLPRTRPATLLFYTFPHQERGTPRPYIARLQSYNISTNEAKKSDDFLNYTEKFLNSFSVCKIFVIFAV
jgi:hypothetical protein